MEVIPVTVAKTSLEAYRKKIEDGSKQTDEQKCFKLIDEKGPITMKAMEPFMNKNKHKFSGRIRDLKDKDLVEKTGTKDGHQVLETVEQSDVDRVDENGNEFVSMSEVDTTDSEDVESLFVDDKQSKELEPGDVIYG